MSKPTIVTAPEKYDAPDQWEDVLDRFAVFLAGSIDNGVAPDWQKDVLEAFGDQDVMLLNPRRKDWDPEASEEVIREQVRWELDALEFSDLIIMYIAENSMAPISLLELGLYAKSRKLVLAVHPSYYRRINVEEVCLVEGIPLFESLDELIEYTKNNINEYNRK